MVHCAAVQPHGEAGIDGIAIWATNSMSAHHSQRAQVLMFAREVPHLHDAWVAHPISLRSSRVQPFLVIRPRVLSCLTILCLQDFFSVEAFADFWRQLLATYTTPEGLETPTYTVLR